jgi:hypothetical protein
MLLTKESVNLVYSVGVCLSTLVLNPSVDNKVCEELHLLGCNVAYSSKFKLSFHASFLFGVFFKPEGGGYMFVRNIG